MENYTEGTIKRCHSSIITDKNSYSYQLPLSIKFAIQLLVHGLREQKHHSLIFNPMLLQPTVMNFLLATLISITLMGCQGFQLTVPGELAMEDEHFLDTWESYNYCMEGSDIPQMLVHLQILNSAPKPISLDDSPIPVPLFLKKLSSARSSRLAVDPRAMAASCSIRLAEVAQQSANSYMALLTLQSILKNYPEPQYAWYVTKASEAIEHFSSVHPTSLSSRDSLVR